MFKLPFTRLPKPRGFQYKPLYWNEEKEEFEKRVAQARMELDREHSEKTYSILQRGSLKSAWKSSRGSNQYQMNYSVRLWLIIGVLSLLAYQFLFR